MAEDKYFIIKIISNLKNHEYFYCLVWRIWKKISKSFEIQIKIIAEICLGIPMLDWLIEDYLPLNSSIILATGHHMKVSNIPKRITK